jgi:UDP-N-acetylglucosamine 2-epimerase (non-hydrolysing)
MKIAAVVKAMRDHPELEPYIVHTGQHYDEKLSKVMFEDLGLPEPDINLEVGSASHAVQTAEIMKRFEPIALEQKFDLIMVVGDVNSTVACSLVGVKLGIPVAHVEAGLRSFDRAMPEEVNRIVTDSISNYLFITEPSGVVNLQKEGVSDEKIFFVGNTMIDTLLEHRDRADQSNILTDLDLNPGAYAVLTLHRPSNVDNPATFEGLLTAFEEIQKELPILFPAHPRTVSQIQMLGLKERISSMQGFRMIEPVGYLDFLKLMADARIILTDSGGIQEEATVLRVPCLTLRENTERPITIESGWNQLVGTDSTVILKAFRAVEERTRAASSQAPEKWDGKAGKRIAETLLLLAKDQTSVTV